MESPITCYCGRSFLASAAFKNHSKGCSLSKKRLSSALTKAQELYKSKKCRLSPTSRDEVSYQDLGSPTIDESASQPESSSVSGVSRTQIEML